MTEEVRNTSFSMKLPTMQLAWDSTSLGALKECSRKYYYSIVLGYVPRADSVHLVFGLLVHGASERYNHAKASGASHEQALCAAVRWALVESWDAKLQRPLAVLDDKNKNRANLIRTVVWYFEQFAEDPLETLILSNGKPAVELSFDMDLGTRTASTEEQLTLCGHMDRVAVMNGVPYVVDIKTTKNTLNSEFFHKYSPDNQFSTYTLAGKVAFDIPLRGLIVDAAQVAVSFSRFARGIVTRDEAQLEEFLRDTLLYVKHAEGYAKEGYWPMNDKSCSNYGGCPYREVCSKSPASRDKWLSMGFQKRVWDPLQRRGDI